MSRSFKVFLFTFVLFVGATIAFVTVMRPKRPEAIRPNDLYTVIQQQVAAFRAQDIASAYRQVSTGFQERFNIEAFTDLIHSDYPPLRFADRVEFGAVNWDGKHALVPAYFFMPDNEVVPCFYSLVQEESGWKIDGVHVQKRWRAGRRLGGLRT
jgi:Domain of unknown function (DUF4864)